MTSGAGASQEKVAEIEAQATPANATADDVFNCYRTLLRRPPESEAIVENHLSYGYSLWQLIDSFLQCDEFRARTEFHPRKLAQRNFFAKSLTGAERMRCYFGHYAYLCANFTDSAIHSIISQDIPIYTTKSNSVAYKIVLSTLPNYQAQGEMTLVFSADTLPLYFMSFTIVPGRIVGLPDSYTILHAYPVDAYTHQG